MKDSLVGCHSQSDGSAREGLPLRAGPSTRSNDCPSNTSRYNREAPPAPGNLLRATYPVSRLHPLPTQLACCFWRAPGPSVAALLYESVIFGLIPPGPAGTSIG